MRPFAIARALAKSRSREVSTSDVTRPRLGAGGANGSHRRRGTRSPLALGRSGTQAPSVKRSDGRFATAHNAIEDGKRRLLTLWTGEDRPPISRRLQGRSNHRAAG